MRKIAIFLTILFSLCTLSLSALPLYALAEEPTTGVLADLAKDSSFRASDYVAIEGDYSLQLLTLAESNEGDLIVYVYQPGAVSDPYRATYIRLCCGIGEDLSPLDYALALLDYDGVFFKYKVRGLYLSDEAFRYYVVIQLMRSYIEGVDPPAGGGNSISNVSYEVGLQFLFENDGNGSTVVSSKTITVIEITDKFVGILRYGVNRYGIADNGRDFHFVAFSTDFPIENLLEAEVEYKAQDFDGFWGSSSSWGDVSDPLVATVESGEVLSYETSNGYFFGVDLHKREHSFSQIASSERFLEESTEDYVLLNMGLFNVVSEDAINNEGTELIRGYDWVLTFLDTQFIRDHESNSQSILGHFTRVSDVTILRLYFVTNGVSYNLGAVDNMQSGAMDEHGNPAPVNEESIKITDSDGRTVDDFWELIKRLAKIAGIVLAVVVVCALLGPVLPYILKGIWFVISAPFKLVASLFLKGKKKGK